MITTTPQSLPSKKPAPLPVPHTALVLYGVNNDVGAITQHKIVKGALGNGHLISPTAVHKQLLEATQSEHPNNLNLLPANVLKANQQSIMWYQKRQKRFMWFRINGKATHSVMVEWPPLLFEVNLSRKSFKIFALASNSRPHLNTRLYHAPLMNIGADGVLCQGTARIPKTVTVSNLSDCEACLYDSIFTHVNHLNTLAGKSVSNEDHVAFWVEKSETKSRVTVRELAFVGRLSERMGK